MIANLFSEHKSCIDRLKQHSCFFSPLFVVLPISAVFVLQIEQTCEDLLLRCCFYSSLCCLLCPPPSSFTTTPSIYFVWFNKPYSPDVRQSQESREAVRSLRSVFGVWTASNCSISCTQSPQLGFFKRKTLKLNIEHRSVYLHHFTYLQLHLDLSLFGATGKLLPPTTFSTAVQSLQPFPDITQDLRQTPHLAIFSWWVHVCASDSRTSAFQLCVLRWNGLCKGAPAEPNLRKWAGGF